MKKDWEIIEQGLNIRSLTAKRWLDDIDRAVPVRKYQWGINWLDECDVRGGRARVIFTFSSSSSSSFSSSSECLCPALMVGVVAVLSTWSGWRGVRVRVRVWVWLWAWLPVTFASNFSGSERNQTGSKYLVMNCIKVAKFGVWSESCFKDESLRSTVLIDLVLELIERPHERTL